MLPIAITWRSTFAKRFTSRIHERIVSVSVISPRVGVAVGQEVDRVGDRVEVGRRASACRGGPTAARSAPKMFVSSSSAADSMAESACSFAPPATTRVFCHGRTFVEKKTTLNRVRGSSFVIASLDGRLRDHDAGAGRELPELRLGARARPR